MIRKGLLAISLLTLSMTAGAASAETIVGGDVEIEVEVDDVTTDAANRAYAETSIGSINDDTTIFGEVEIEVEADDVRTEAGLFGNACTSIGSVGGCNRLPGLPAPF